MNLKLMLQETARRYPDKTAIASGECRMSYTELDEVSNRVGNALIQMGVKKGDRVALLLSNCLEFVTIYFGIVKVGGIAVPLDTKYKATELDALLSDCQAKVVFAESPNLQLIEPVLPHWKSVERVIEVGTEYKGRFANYQEIAGSGSAKAVGIGLAPEDTAHIAYTSGPTLRPRGVVLSHGSLATEVAISAAGFQQTDKDVVVLFALPLHHAFGLVVIALTSIYKGSTVIILPGVSISGLTELIERERATMFMAVPFIYTLMVNQAEEEGAVKHDLRSLRFCGSAGAALPVDVLDKFRKLYGLKIVDFWGMTESSAHVTCQSLNGAAKRGSVGKALTGWELRIVDDGDRELLPKQPGEIVVRGPVMTEYYHNPQATARTLRNGWLYTGDLGWVDDDGEVFLSGMKKDMIIVKGQNVYPSDIETILRNHPKVAEAAVIGAPDEARGQIIKAFVQLKAGEEATEQEMKRFCGEHLANYKVPKQVIFADSLPKTAAGEIRKEDLC